MASGEVATRRDRAELPRGYVVTSSGRVSGVTEPGEVSVTYPFPVKDLVRLDDALKYGSRKAKARFAVYVGDLGADTAATAREMLAEVPTPEQRGAAGGVAEPEGHRGRLRRRGAGPRHRGVGSARGEGRRGVLQLRQPDDRPGQRDQRDERRRLPGLGCSREIAFLVVISRADSYGQCNI